MRVPTIILMSLFAAASAIGQQAILNGSIAVNTSSNVAIPFYVGESGGIVTGRFRAEGSINAYILDSDGLINFRGGTNAPTYYNSGNIIVANINVRLSQGSYYLVFHNQNILSNKSVFGSITVRSVESERSTAGICTVRRGGATIFPENTQRRIRLKAGTKLTLIEERGNRFVLVRHGRIVADVLASEINCK